MELPLGGPALRHYTRSRPRPHRQIQNHRPSKPQEPVRNIENEVPELMGRVDEGVEEFFTKRVLPVDPLKDQEEEPPLTVEEVALASAVPCQPPSRTLRRRLGEFFTLKKRRGVRSDTSHDGRAKKTSIVDLIRPLREVAKAEKDKDKVKENESGKGKEIEDDSPVTGESVVQETCTTGPTPIRVEAGPPRRALRDGKSQSLILLSGSATAGTGNTKSAGKKHSSDGQHSFEQKLHLMLQRIGVSKPPPGETQNQEGEMKKAESEGTIIDNRPEPPRTSMKIRTMSTSSDTRRPIRSSVSAHESAGKPTLPPKPFIKPSPPPTSSGCNTPEKELAQIQEGEPIPTNRTCAASSPITTTIVEATTSTPISPISAPVTTEPTFIHSTLDSTNSTI
ncbi:capping protein, Arp2/3 and myosin-I linker protein 2-like [Aplochiton taeniatus]